MHRVFRTDNVPSGYTVRWVSSLADGNGDGTTPTIGGANGAWTLAQAVANATAGLLIRLQDDGTYTLTADLSILIAATTAHIVLTGADNQNGPNANGGRPLIDCNNYKINFLNKTGWWLEHLQIDNGPADGTPMLASALQITCWDVVFANSVSGISANRTFSVVGCTFTNLGDPNNPSNATAVNGPAVVIGSLFQDVDGNAIKNTSTTTPCTVLFCHFANVALAAIRDAAPMSTSLQNTFYNCATAIEHAGGYRVDLLNLITNCAIGVAGSPTLPIAIELLTAYHQNTLNVSGLAIDREPITADPRLLNPPSDLRPGPTGAAWNVDPLFPMPSTNRLNCGCYQGQSFKGSWSKPIMQIIALNETEAARRLIPFRLVAAADGQTPITGATPTLQLTKPGGSPTTITPTVAEIGDGWYRIALAAEDVDTAGTLLLRATATGALASEIEILCTPAITDAARAAAGLAALGTPTVTVKSPFVADGHWEIQEGDDYTGLAAILRTWRNYAGHDPAGADLYVIITSAADYEAGNPTPALTKNLGDIIVSTVEDDGSITLSAAISLTEAEVNSLSPTPPADRFAYYYQIALETPGGDRTTLERGRLTVWGATD
jgi:hypothetical protein